MSRPLALPTRCEECKRRPPLRIYDALVEAARHLPDDTPIQSWMCRCGRLHWITAQDVREAV